MILINKYYMATNKTKKNDINFTNKVMITSYCIIIITIDNENIIVEK